MPLQLASCNGGGGKKLFPGFPIENDEERIKQRRSFLGSKPITSNNIALQVHAVTETGIAEDFTIRLITSVNNIGHATNGVSRNISDCVRDLAWHCLLS